MSSPIQSAPLELDLGRYTLVQEGRSVRLEKQPMELLILLAEKQGQLVSREEIVARLWGDGVFLDTERSINTAIRKIRLALHDNPDHPQFIETVVGKGYRFIAPITVIAPQGAAAPAGNSKEREGWVGNRPSAYALAVVILIVIVAVAFFSGRKRQLPGAGQPPIESIAVLPLVNVSGDPAQEYLADGLTEALITDVAKISRLRVISHTSVTHYKGSAKTLPEIARELKVDAVVEGSVARSGGRVRITAQLVQAAADRHIWADTYERSTTDVLTLEDDVARAIARQVQSQLEAEDQAPSLPPLNPEAQDAYLKGLHEADKFSEQGLNKSLEYFREAVEKDPQFAQAWAGLARAYGLLSLFHYGSHASITAQADTAAARAIQLDPNLSEAHVVLAGALTRRRSWAEAEKELRRAIALNPSNAVAHQYLGYLLAGVLGRPDEGILEMQRALDLDPLSPSQKNSLGAALYWARHYDDALRVFREVPDGDANTERRHRRMAEIYGGKGMQQESVRELVQAMELTGRHGLAAEVEQAYRSSGYAAARKAFFMGDLRQKTAQERPGSESGDALWIAADYTMLGDNRQAFQWLDRAFELDDESLMYLKVEGQFSGLRTDPRFAELLRRLGIS